MGNSKMKELAMATNAVVETSDLGVVERKTGNLFKSLLIIGKRSNQIAGDLKEELQGKLQEFAPTTDNLEEIFENREQIEISKFYEKMPHPTLMATKEFLEDNIYYRHTDEE